MRFDFNEEPSGYSDDDIIVTDYTTGYYEGWGDALVLKSNKVFYYNLGHCSCYGPFESGGDEYSIEQFLELQKSARGEWPDNIGAKFEELLREYLETNEQDIYRL